MTIDRTSGSVAAGLIATVLLAAAAMSRHPQGNFSRVMPFLLAACLVWVAVVATAAGRRAAVTTACALAAPVLLAVAGYAFFFMPIDYAECGRLVQELSVPYCRSHGPWALVLADAAGSIVATTTLVAVRRKAQ